MVLLYFYTSRGTMKMSDIMMDAHFWLKVQLVWITVLITIAIGSSCLGTPLSVFVQYKHSYYNYILSRGTSSPEPVSGCLSGVPRV